MFFDGLSLEVSPGVYRPSEWMLPTARLAERHLPQGGTLVDLGCGVGTIGLWIGTRRKDVSIIGIDRNPLALALMRANAERLGVQMRGVLTDGLNAVSHADMVVNTLPYEGPQFFTEDDCEGDEPRDSYIADDSFAWSLVQAHAMTEKMAVYALAGFEEVFDMTGWSVLDYIDDEANGTRSFVLGAA